MTSNGCLSFSDHVDTKHNALRRKRGLIQRSLLLHMLIILVHCVGVGGLRLYQVGLLELDGPVGGSTSTSAPVSTKNLKPEVRSWMLNR